MAQFANEDESQLLTLFTTPIIYLYLDRLQARLTSPRK
jgi:hypothetical protein